MGVSVIKRLWLLLLLILTFFGGNVSAEENKSQLIIINKANNKLAYYQNGELQKEYKVATGYKNSLTPEGTFKIIKKIKNRPYYKEKIPGGDPRNPLGDRWLGLAVPGTYGNTYGIHGNNNPSSIGTYASAGCIRMYDEEVRELFDKVALNTPVTIVNKKNYTFDQLAEKSGYKLKSYEKYGIADLLRIPSEEEQNIIAGLFNMGKLSGYEDSTFRPFSKITRAEFLTMASRMLEFGNKDGDVQFIDAKEGDWYYAVLKQAYVNNLITGKKITDEGVQIAPNTTITKEEMITILIRLYEENSEIGPIEAEEAQALLEVYNDHQEISNWAKPYVVKALKVGLLSIEDGKQLKAKTEGSRLQSALMSYQLFKEGDK